MKIGINGFGRIGRAFFRLAFGEKDIEIVAVNDPFVAPDVARYLLSYDSAYGRYGRKVEATGDAIAVDGVPVQLLKERDPSQLPWGSLGVDLVVEATGVFRAYEGASGCAAHLGAGATRVLLTVPPKGDGAERIPQIVYGVNHDQIATAEGGVVSAASCTTNSLVPVAHVLEEQFGIVHAFLTTVHGYTADQKLVDAAHKSLTRGRAAAANIVPTSTGAAQATAKVIPALAGKMDGVALRVPVITGSVSDFTAVLKRAVTADEVNAALRAAAEGALSGILGVSDDPLVSTDIIGDSRASVVDLTATAVVDGSLLKIMTFYDNEWGYTNQLLRIARAL
ncbi:MAG: type I glyceraldehyde-3-phosphate dehydrogenase [Candidatus Bipolaricaulota bacterium]|nr:MAG: type I glyceraldehyde-3-phosphate dehydrogenase [Candidatus Bipolaricaulota bacterium]